MTLLKRLLIPFGDVSRVHREAFRSTSLLELFPERAGKQKEDFLGFSKLIVPVSPVLGWGFGHIPRLSCRISIVVIEHPAEPLSALHASFSCADAFDWSYQPISQPLMVSFLRDSGK